MLYQDLAVNEIIQKQRKAIRKLKVLIWMIYSAFLFFIFSLHFFGKWSITQNHTTQYSGDPNTESTKLISDESELSFINQCLIFRAIHDDDTYFEGDIKNDDDRPYYWKILNSCKFTIVNHIMILFIFFVLLIAIYYLLRNYYYRRVWMRYPNEQ